MKKIESFCCSCATDGYPCLGKNCPNQNVDVYYCDVCGDAIDDGEVYESDGDELCEGCLLDRYRKEC